MEVINLNDTRQTFDFDCGAKALQTVFAYYGEDIREDNLLKELGTTEEGTEVRSLLKAAKKRGFKVKVGTTTFEILKSLVVGCSLPVIVPVQAWAEKVMTIDDWKEDWDDGHYVIVIGIDEGIVVFEDPSSLRRTWMTQEEFVARWHDVGQDGKKLYNFAIVLYGKKPDKKSEHMD